MIHYHGTPMGGTRDAAVRFLAGRDALIPFPRPEDLGTALSVCRSVVFDNGAFSVWKSGEVLDVEGYTEWVARHRNHPRFAWGLIPDVIEGDEAANDALVDEWPDELRCVGVPVWHLHESLHRLVRLSHEWRTVALGSSGEYGTPTADVRSSWHRRMCEAMGAVCDDGVPRCKLHGLRMLAPAIVERFPFASADSTNVAQNGTNLSRRYAAPNGVAQREILAKRIEAAVSPAEWQGAEVQAELFA